MSNEFERVERDPELAARLRQVLDDPPLEEVDWAALRSGVRARAELPLARLRRQAAPPRWRRPLVTLAAAAGLAAVALVGGRYRGADTLPAPRPATVAAASGVSVEEAMRADLSDQEFGQLALYHDNPDALLQIAAAAH